MALDREIDSIADANDGKLERARRRALLVLRARTMRAYRKLLLSETGALRPEAQLVLADLSRAAGLGKSRKGFNGEELNYFEGQRGLLLHIFARMEPHALRQLARKMREADADE